MQKVFMGGSGVIDLKQLDQSRRNFYYLSHLIDYPQPELQSAGFLENFEKEYDENSPYKAQVAAIITEFQAQSFESLTQTYSNYFEMNKRFTLYMTFYRFEDSRERGEILAKLKMLYEMFGVAASDQELTDYLPLMLEFLAYGDWQDETQDRVKDLTLLFSVVEDGTYKLLENGAIYQDQAYFKLLKIIRAELGKCVTKQQISQAEVR